MMNCNNFKARLHEYLDETLDAEVQAAAREHLDQCSDCRRAVIREEAFAKSLRHSLDRATAELSLRPEMRCNILKALESNSPPPSTWWLTCQNFICNIVRPARASAALLCLLLLFFGVQFYRRTTKESLAKASAQASQYSRVVHVPIPAQTHVFEHQNNAVVDAISASVAVGHAVFFEDKKPWPELSPKPL
jgi:anti-sigma factor RsiW